MKVDVILALNKQPKQLKKKTGGIVSTLLVIPPTSCFTNVLFANVLQCLYVIPLRS